MIGHIKVNVLWYIVACKGKWRRQRWFGLLLGQKIGKWKICKQMGRAYRKKVVKAKEILLILVGSF